jgi:hypothetical protein
MITSFKTAGMRDGASHCAKILSVFYDSLDTADPNDPEVIIKIDISNAFNTTCRALKLYVLRGRASLDYAHTHTHTQCIHNTHTHLCILHPRLPTSPYLVYISISTSLYIHTYTYIYIYIHIQYTYSLWPQKEGCYCHL